MLETAVVSVEAAEATFIPVSGVGFSEGVVGREGTVGVAFVGAVSGGVTDLGCSPVGGDGALRCSTGLIILTLCWDLFFSPPFFFPPSFWVKGALSAGKLCSSRS